MKNFHNTLTKWTVLLLGGAVIFACTDLSGIEERVDSLDSRITALETQIESLNKNISTITALVNESTFITKVDRTENGFTITMSDSEVYTIENGKTGDTPVITIDEDGYWMAQYGDNEPQYITVDGTADGEKILATATAPLFRVSAKGYWEVSTDGGEIYSTVYLEDGTTPAQAIGQPGEPGEQGDSFFKDVSYNEEDGILSLTLADGKTYSFTVTSDFACEIEGVTYAEAEIFQPGASREFKVIYKGIDDVYLTVPQGWSATLEGEESPAILTVTPPAAKTKISADSQSDVVVHAVSGDRSIFAKMTVELSDAAMPEVAIELGEVTAESISYTLTPNGDVTSWKYMLLPASETTPATAEDFNERATDGSATGLKLTQDANGNDIAAGTTYILYVLAVNSENGEVTQITASESATPMYDNLFTAYDSGNDIVIGNPPYIHFEAIRALGAIYGVNTLTYDARGDIYCLFYEKGISLLREQGVLCYITSNSWLRAAYGARLRAFLPAYVKTRLLLDFAGAKIFDTATVDTNILLAERTDVLKKTSLPQTSPTRACLAQEGRQALLADLPAYVRAHAHEIAFPADGSSWAILSPIEQAIKEKIERYGTPLKEWDVTIKFGIKTGADRVFILDGKTKDRLIAQDPRSAEIIRPILRGRDITRYGYTFADKWLIATFPSLNLDIDDYPAVRDYLLTFDKRILAQTGEKNIDGIKGKNARKKTGNKWFETQDQIAYWSLFNQPHLVWKRIGSKIRFGLCQEEMFSLDSTCILVGKHMQYLCAILNSKIGHYLLKNSPTTGTGDLLLSVQALEPVCIVQPNEQILMAVSRFFFNQITEDDLLHSFASFYHFTNEELAVICRESERIVGKP